MTETIQERLNKSIPSECVSERKGLSYITGRFVKQTLNEIFGWDGWSYQVISQHLEHKDDEVVQWFAHVRLTVNTVDGQIHRDGMAVGHGTLTSKGEQVSAGRENEVVDFACAEAVTDALKRAAVSLGFALGLELYPLTNDNGKKNMGKPKAKPRAKKTNGNTSGPKRAKKF